MRFQERDGQILQAIYNYDGMLSRRQLKAMFWPHTRDDRAMDKRLSKLARAKYITWPRRHQYRTKPIPRGERLVWLDWQGILWVAAQHNVKLKTPKNPSENQRRGLAKQLRDQGIRWLREPRWIQLRHDLAVVDFRLMMEQSVSELPPLKLETWLHESEFRSAIFKDKVKVRYAIKSQDGQAKLVEKRVYPDSYFEIVAQQGTPQGELAPARFLLELDNATHPKARFGREKVAPGLAYVNHSPEYRARFGENSGRWLVVTTGKRRRRNLMRQTQQVGKGEAKTFLFTTFGQLKTGNVLTEPVWYRGDSEIGKEKPIPLMTSPLRE